MNITHNKYKKTLGFKGENKVIDKLKTIGFEIYKKNIKYTDSEIDIVAYRYDRKRYSLDIRIIEVKTRGSYDFNLEALNISKKWRLIRPHMFNIKAEIDALFDILNYSEVHFDLALVRHKNEAFDMYAYFKDINLML